MRRRILELLTSFERPAGELVSALQPDAAISQPAVSQHLKVLRDARLVRMRAEGTRRIYAVDAAGVNTAQTWLTGLAMQFAELAQPPAAPFDQFAQPPAAPSDEVAPSLDATFDQFAQPLDALATEVARGKRTRRATPTTTTDDDDAAAAASESRTRPA